MIPVPALLAGLVALVSPWLALDAGGPGAPGTIAVLTVAITCAAAVLAITRAATLVAVPVPVPVHTRRRTPPVPAGRATDPVHHPLRPRAPGTV